MPGEPVIPPGGEGIPSSDPTRGRGGPLPFPPPLPPAQHSLSEEPLHVSQLPPGKLAKLPGGAENATTSPPAGGTLSSP